MKNERLAVHIVRDDEDLSNSKYNERNVNELSNRMGRAPCAIAIHLNDDTIFSVNH